MNQSKYRELPGEIEEPVITVRDRLQSNTGEKVRSEASVVAPGKGRHGKGCTYISTPASPWSHLKFGLGALAVLVIPPMMPGVTGRGLIMGYVGALVVIYTIVCVWGVVRSMRSPGAHRVISRSRRYS